MTRQAYYDALAERLEREQPVAWGIWAGASDVWAMHVLDCEVCRVGQSCPAERRQAERVVDLAAFIREAGG
jgi:hypothetical protein